MIQLTTTVAAFRVFRAVNATLFLLKELDNTVTGGPQQGTVLQTPGAGTCATISQPLTNASTTREKLSVSAV